jgi:hypothetical protein
MARDESGNNGEQDHARSGPPIAGATAGAATRVSHQDEV